MVPITDELLDRMTPEEFEALPYSSKLAIAQYLGRGGLLTLMRLMGD